MPIAKPVFVLPLAAVLFLTACTETGPRQNTGTAAGAVAGGILGGIITGRPAGAAVGAGIGAIAGGAIGQQLDIQSLSTLAPEQQKNLLGERLYEHITSVEGFRSFPGWGPIPGIREVTVEGQPAKVADLYRYSLWKAWVEPDGSTSFDSLHDTPWALQGFATAAPPDTQAVPL